MLKTKLLISALLSLIISIFSIYILKSAIESKKLYQKDKTILGTEQQASQTKVTANIGLKTYIKIYGFTSPLSYVFLTSTGLSDSTLSENNGYFSFIINYVPKNLKEVCINSSDQLGRTTNLTCFPIKLKSGVEIGPVVLSPTLSLSKPVYLQNDEILISGQTIPEQQVFLKFFRDNNKNNYLFSSVFAQENNKSGEVLSKSDSQGNYSFSLKKSTYDDLRIAGYTTFNNQTSPLSYTLKINTYNLWYFFNQYLKIWSKIIKKHLLEIFFILEAIFIFYLIENKIKREKPKAIILYKSKLPTKNMQNSLKRLS